MPAVELKKKITCGLIPEGEEGIIYGRVNSKGSKETPHGESVMFRGVFRLRIKDRDVAQANVLYLPPIGEMNLEEAYNQAVEVMLDEDPDNSPRPSVDFAFRFWRATNTDKRPGGSSYVWGCAPVVDTERAPEALEGIMGKLAALPPTLEAQAKSVKGAKS